MAPTSSAVAGIAAFEDAAEVLAHAAASGLFDAVAPAAAPPHGGSNALARASPSPGFTQDQATAAAAQLRQLVVTACGAPDRATAADILAALPKALPSGCPPLLALFVVSELVRRLSADAWDESDDDDSNDEDEKGEGGKEEGSGSNPLAGKSNTQIADWLLEKLNERATLHKMLTEYAAKFGADGIWELLQEVTVQVKEGGPLTETKDGERKRTAGGVFIKLAKQREALNKKRSEEQRAPAFELRPYQLTAADRIEREGGNWVVSAPTNSGKTAIFIELARRLLAKKPSAKIVVVVPTVNLVQQQCIAFEKAGFRAVASGQPGAANGKQQQGSNHRAPSPITAGAQPGGLAPAVDWFCGDKPMLPAQWESELGRLSVFVMEAQSLVNLLTHSSRVAHPSQIDMLVLDEVHHVTGDHPYARLMNLVRAVPEGQPRPQVLGFSASPVNGSTEGKVLDALSSLLWTLGARPHLIAEDDEHVQQVAPAPEEEVEGVESREVDREVRLLLRTAMHEAAARIETSLLAALSDPACPPESAAAARLRLGSLQPQGVMVQNPAHVHNLLCRWTRGAFDVARAWRLFHLGTSLQVVETLRRAEVLVGDMGYECGLQFLAQRLLDLALRVKGAEAATQTAGSSTNSKRQKRNNNNGASSGSAESDSTSAGRRATPAQSPAQNNNAAAAPAQPAPSSSTDAAQVLAELGAAVAALPQPSDIDASDSYDEAGAGTSAAALLARLPRCPDLSGLDAVTLTRAVVLPAMAAWHAAVQAGASSTTSAPGNSKHLVDGALSPMVPGGLSPPPASFPKLWALVQFVRQYRDRDVFHGIIFSRTRQGAHFLAEALRTAAAPLPRLTRDNRSAGASTGEPLLGFVQSVSLLVGHGNTTRNKGRRLHGEALLYGQGPTVEGQAASGMSAIQQHNILEQFKTPGRRLLVATNVAEEGLDVPTCEFVVRYSPPGTGVQRMQGRGRARKLGAKYKCLVQLPDGRMGLDGSSDVVMHQKSLDEERAVRKALAYAANAFKEPGASGGGGGGGGAAAPAAQSSAGAVPPAMTVIPIRPAVGAPARPLPSVPPLPTLYM